MMMLKHMLKFGVLALLLGPAWQTAQAQNRGGGDRGSDRGGSDRDREEMRRRYEEMRSRFSGGGDSNGNRFSGGGFPGGGFDRGGGFPGGGFDRGGGFPGGGFDRGGGFPGGGFDRGGGSDRGRDGGDDRSRDERSRDDSSRSGSSRSGTPKIQPYVPTPYSAIGVDLPANYVAGDSDGDGQIDLLEWRQWKPSEIANFMTMDTNKDGFLTARELIIAENFPAETTAASAANTVASVTTPTGSDANGNKAAVPGEKPSAAEARYVFPRLDKNNNGQIEENEWNSSKSIRKGFADAGIELKLPADKATFLAAYPPQRLIPTQRLTN